MKIVQDLPWNTEDLKSGREQTDATSPCLASIRKDVQNLLGYLKPANDCIIQRQTARMPSLLLLEIALLEFEVFHVQQQLQAVAFVHGRTNTPVLPRQAWHGPTSAACCSGALWQCAPGQRPERTSPGEPTGPAAPEDASFHPPGHSHISVNFS